MKTTLLASTALVLSAGVASAAGFEMVDTGHDHSVVVGGDARMGITNDNPGSYDTDFTSRIRISFTASGETDGGLGFGGSIRADNADDGASGTAGNVYVSMGGHKLAMGDVSGGAEAAVGDVSGVGLTGLGDYNEIQYDANDDSDTRPNALYSYTGGALSLYVGVGGDGGGEDIGDNLSFGAAYSAGNFGVSIGIENDDAWNDEGVYVGAHATFGAATFKVIAGDTDEYGDMVAASVDFTAGATTFTAFALSQDDIDDRDSWGLGVSHDLGGGASLKAGVVDSDDEGDTIWDAGIAMTF